MPQSALLGGVFIGVLSVLPIVNVGNACCCMWVIAGGLLTAYLENQRAPQSITVARGAFLGLLAGLVSAVVWLIASLALNPLFAPFQAQMGEALSRAAADADPTVRAQLEQISGLAASPVHFVVGFVLQLCIGAVFATAGGAIGATIFRRPGPVMTPPPLPPEA
jgi:hypothetical protein